MRLRGLTILVSGTDRARFRTALTLAAAQAAVGGGATLFLDGVAVTLLADGDPADAAHGAAGSPTVAELVDTVLALGGHVLACQSGLALAGMDLATLDPRIEAGGMTGVVAALGDDRLVAL